MQEWIEKHRSWPKKSTVIEGNRKGDPKVFRVGKWLLNKKYYALGKEKQMMVSRSPHIHDELDAMRKYEEYVRRLYKNIKKKQ